MASNSEHEQWWYNTRTGKVESSNTTSLPKDLLGPYATREEAARALEKVRERNKEWDSQD